MTFFRILFGFDLIIALIVLFFFVLGISDGTVYSANFLYWLAMLVGLAAILSGSVLLNARGQRRQAYRLLLTLAIPGFLVGLLFAAAVILHPRWN